MRKITNLKEYFQKNINKKAYNLLSGDIVLIEKPIFTGSFRNAQFCHNEYILAEITSEKYGVSNKHRFCYRILDSTDKSLINKKTRIQGKNIYSNSILIKELSEDSEDRDLRTQEKNGRKKINEEKLEYQELYGYSW